MLLPYVAVGAIGLLTIFGVLFRMIPKPKRAKALTRVFALIALFVLIEAALVATLGTPLKGEVIYKLLGLP
jgi:predicted membrane channel-forming protein YqfA (hemolysin III family)